MAFSELYSSRLLRCSTAFHPWKTLTSVYPHPAIIVFARNAIECSAIFLTPAQGLSKRPYSIATRLTRQLATMAFYVVSTAKTLNPAPPHSFQGFAAPNAPRFEGELHCKESPSPFSLLSTRTDSRSDPSTRPQRSCRSYASP